MEIAKTLRRFFDVCKGAYQQLGVVRFLIWFGIAVLMLALTCQLFLMPTSTNFAFTKKQCTRSLVAFPNLQKTTSTHMGKAVFGKTITIGKLPIFARSVCYEFNVPPNQGEPIIAKHALFGVAVFSKSVRMQVGELPKLKTETVDKTISTAKPLVIGLTRQDSFFDYAVTVGQVKSNCVAQGAAISCDVASLKLVPAKQYEFAISQEFNNQQSSPPAAVTATTANPVTLTAPLVSGATIYDAPASIVITADRELQSVGGVSIAQKQADGSQKTINARVQQSGKTITITFAEPLQRQAEFIVVISEANAPDGGVLIAPFSTSFKTSGGPQVVGKNIGDRAVPMGQKFVLTLSQAPKKGQDFSKLFGLKIGEAHASATVSVTGKTVTITPSDPIDKCAAFQLYATDGIKNEYDVTGGTAWSFNSRITCATVFSIGTSVKGRSIIAYRFGVGSSTILFNGNLHGNEANTKRLLDSWVYELEGNPSRIPNGRSVVVIPLSNPDGYAAGSRLNANGVDLNRNFAANNWKSTVKMPSGETLATGGGTTPMSEPESLALSNYISAMSPRLVMSYHSQGNIAVANDAGNSWNLTRAYSAKSGYGAENGNTLGNFFDYDTTGAMEDWLADKKGIAAILIELSTRSNDEFSRNKNAMWQMVTDF